MLIQILFNIVINFIVISLIGFSFSIIFSICKYYAIHFSAIITFGGYFSWFFNKEIGSTFTVSIILGFFTSIFIGLLLEFSIFRNLRKVNSNAFLLIIASLGIFVILQNSISLLWGDDTKIIRVGDVKVGHKVWGAYITDIQIITIVVSLGLFMVMVLFLKKTRLGRQIRAVSDNEQLANVFGINSDRVFLWVFGIGSGMAVIAGILVAFDTGMTPTMGFNLLLYGVITMIIGGVGSTWGLVGGAFLLATAQHLGAYYIDSKWMEAIAYTILILFLIWRPLGFSGKKLKKTEI